MFHGGTVRAGALLLRLSFTVVFTEGGKYRAVSGGPHVPSFGEPPRRTPSTENTVTLVAVIYSNERVQCRGSKGKGTWGETRGNQAWASRNSRCEVTQERLASFS